MNAKTLRALADEWFARAEEDFAFANLALNRHDAPHLLAYLAHASSEKYLKGLLVLHHKDIQDEFKIHNLSKLYEYALEVEPSLSEHVLRAAKVLDPVYIPSRYPGDMPEPFWGEAEKLFEAAELIRGEIKAIIDKVH